MALAPSQEQPSQSPFARGGAADLGLIALILAVEGWLLRFCGLPFLQPIGRASYGAYVYHAPVLMLHNALFGSAAASSLAFSSANLPSFIRSPWSSLYTATASLRRRFEAAHAFG